MFITLKDEMVKGAGCSERVEKKRITIYYMGLFTKPISSSFTLFPCINTCAPISHFSLKLAQLQKKKSEELITQKGTLKECGDRNYWNRKETYSLVLILLQLKLKKLQKNWQQKWVFFLFPLLQKVKEEGGSYSRGVLTSLKLLLRGQVLIQVLIRA